MCTFDVLKLYLPPHWISNELQGIGTGSTVTSICGQVVRSDSFPLHSRVEMIEVTGLPPFSTEVD